MSVRFLQESDNFIGNHLNGSAYTAERNCGHNLVLILQIHRFFKIFFF